jgi:hypothetical protein
MSKIPVVVASLLRVTAAARIPAKTLDTLGDANIPPAQFSREK